MQNLNLLIILIKFSFVFGMPHRRHQQPGEGSSSARSVCYLFKLENKYFEKLFLGFSSSFK